MCGDDDVESVFLYDKNKSMSSSSWDNDLYYNKASERNTWLSFFYLSDNFKMSLNDVTPIRLIALGQRLGPFFLISFNFSIFN